MKCINCGGELPSGANHCPNCGAEQTAASPISGSGGCDREKLTWWGKIWSQKRMARKDFWVLSLFILILEGISAVTVVLPLFLIIMDFVITAHRLHDTGRSAWNILWLLLPLIGPIVLLVFECVAGDKEANLYGDIPQRIF